MSKAARALLDTNVVIRIFAGDPQALARLETFAEILVPATVVGELYHGVFRSTRIEANLQRFEVFVRGTVILPCAAETARVYGKLKAELFRKGRPIPENDVWVAALAVQHELTLLTGDNHFKAVHGLKLDLFE